MEKTKKDYYKIKDAILTIIIFVCVVVSIGAVISLFTLSNSKDYVIMGTVDSIVKKAEKRYFVYVKVDGKSITLESPINLDTKPGEVRIIEFTKYGFPMSKKEITYINGAFYMLFFL